MLTNARSLSPKINSLHTHFEEHDLDLALITESWLKDSVVLDRDVIDLEFGTNKKIIYKNRTKTRSSLRRVGGGVSIIYDKTSCSLRERKIVGNGFELVVATGRVGKIARPVALFCVYLEPRMKVADLSNLSQMIATEILALKASQRDPIIVVGGDINNKDMGPAFSEFDDIKQNNFEPTRGNACLDVFYSNLECSTSVWPPLHTDTGTNSDHDCVILQAELPRVRDFTWVRKMVRVHTKEACAQLGREVRETNWEELMSDSSSPDHLVEVFEKTTGEMIDRLFPWKSSRRRSNDDPWITEAIRRMSRRKARVYKREGKSHYWKILQARMDGMVARSKQEFIDRVEAGGTSTREYFSAVRALGNGSSSSDWSVMDLFPGKSELEAGNEIGDFYTRITDQFEPLAPTTPTEPRRAPVSLQEVRGKLKSSKKTNSTVSGDVLPRLVRAFHHDLAVPIQKIFNSVFATASWPLSWKTETTVVIPKVSNPESLGDCRNISCTAFMSKVLESFLLEDIRKEIPPDAIQYGGVKSCSVDHLLVDLYEHILSALDDGDAAVILGVDYKKAFNRLNHAECLSQLQALGASPTTVSLIRSFLTGRSMRTRINGTLSDRKALCGGSPQGSILGCALYCLATQQIDTRLLPVPPRVPDAPPRVPGAPPPGVQMVVRPPVTPPSDPGPMGIMTTALGWPTPCTDDSSTSEDSFHTADGSPQPDQGLVDLIKEYIAMLKYVDDTTTVERVSSFRTSKHYTTATARETVPADKTSSLLAGIVALAEAIGMRVNCKKTQLAVINCDNGCIPDSSICVNNTTITSSTDLKLLGFNLGTEANMGAHVSSLLARFRGKFWSLIHLRRAGVRGVQLFRIFCVFIRPVLETNAVIFHPQLTRTQCHAIERLQQQVLKLCFGFQLSYSRARELFGIDTLEERRERAVRKFVQKAICNPRFASRWFRPRDDAHHDLRHRRRYHETKAKTQRYFKSPLLYMQRVANTL